MDPAELFSMRWTTTAPLPESDFEFGLPPAGGGSIDPPSPVLGFFNSTTMGGVYPFFIDDLVVVLATGNLATTLPHTSHFFLRGTHFTLGLVFNFGPGANVTGQPTSGTRSKHAAQSPTGN
ncbi:hypothetical protein C2845_PM09G19530 [Panicum miliaceum]|uniref:Uncharacterized protein n=1 Tax=Panicum miliaceum TaxID=4540 RepID=A0A3L6RZ68_PANMI|nr:hypothetical protein C2845_PM09G19530 [Panicum miliaceum]